MGLHVYVKFGTDADFTEITSYVRYNSVKFDIKLMNDKFKSVQDSVKMQTIYDATLNARFFESTAWIPAYITYDLQTEQMYGHEAGSEYGFGSDAYGFLTVGNVFTGAIYPTTKDTYKSVPTEGVSFEIVDNSYLLEVDCPAFTYQGFKVFDPADTSHSIIHQLLYSAGLVDSDISSLNTISKELGYISYEAKDETIDKIIDELLYEYHHTYYFNEDGQFCLYDWKHDSITIADIITDAVIKDKNGIKRERNIYEFDGYLVKYNELLSKTDALIYREDIPAEGNLLIPSQAFPVDGEIKTIKQSYSNKWLSDDAKILLTSNHALTLTADAGITKPVETFENLEAQVVIKNTDSVDHRFYQFDIRADVVYTDKENEFTIPTTATLTDDDMELEHVYNDADALEFANALYNNTVRYGLHTYEFKSEASFEVGLCYELEHYSVNVLVIGKKYNQYEHIFEYECLSVGAQVVETPDVLYRLPSGTGSDAPSRYLALEADFNSIDVSARGAILVPTITFKARVLGIPISEVSWSRSDAGSLGLVGGNDYLRTLDTSTVAGEFVTLTITASYGGASYSATYTVKKVYQNPVPHNFGGVTTVPNDYNGEPLIAGDYFLWAGETDGTYTKGKIYIHTGAGWRVEDLVNHPKDGNLVMTLFDDFSKLANDVDSTVIGNTVIKKLVAIEAFIENLKVQMLEVINGTYSAKINATDGLKIAKDGVTLFNAPPSGGIEILGTLKAGSVIPASNVRNGLGQDGNNNNFSSWGYITTAGYFPEGTNGSFGVSGSTYQEYMNDDFIQVDTTKAYTFDMWAKANNGFATTNHYLFYACYDADKNFIPFPTGGTFNYLAQGNLSSAWTKYSTVINGVADGDSPTKFRPGTRFIKIGALFNYSQDAYHELYIAGITLREATPFSMYGTAFQTANGKVKIYNNGTIEAVDGSFTGNIVANSGLFKGIFDTTALRLEPGTANSYSASYANENQAMGFCNYFVSQGLSAGTFYKASIPSGTYDWRYSSSITEQFNGGDVKYVKFDIYSYYVVSFYDSNLAPVTTSGAEDVRLGGVYNHNYVYGTLSITLYTGGDVLQLSDDVPLSPANLEAYQIYMNPTTGALMAKLP